MFEFIDSRFYGRRILIGNICWIFLAFLLVGINSAPTLTIDGSGLLNTQVNFTCVSSSTNQYFASFFKDRQLFAVLSRFGLANSDTIEPPYVDRITTTSGNDSTSFFYTIHLDKLQCSDEGNYNCTISTGIITSSPVKPFHVKMLPRPPNLTAPSNFVVLNDTVTLQCMANVGKPPRNLSLCVRQQKEFNCSEISNLVDLGNCSYTQAATMTFIVTEDTNQATCEVLPRQANDLKVSQDWQVYYPVLAIKLVPAVSQITLIEGESKKLSCQARGKPSPSYLWQFRTKNAPDDSESWTQDGQKLNLNNVGLDKSGIYSCIATNNIRNVTYNMTTSIKINVVPTTPAPTTTIATTIPVRPSSDGSTPKSGPQTDAKNDDWKLIVGIIGAILFLMILIVLLIILYRRRSKPAEIEEPPEKPRNNHEVNLKETKPDLVYSTGHDKGKLPMYNTGFDHNGEDDLYYAELEFDDKPRSRKPIVPLYGNSTSNEPYTTVMPQV